MANTSFLIKEAIKDCIKKTTLFKLKGMELKPWKHSAPLVPNGSMEQRILLKLNN